MKSCSVKLVLRVATLHFSNATAVDTTKKLAAPRIVGEKMFPNTLSNPRTVKII